MDKWAGPDSTLAQEVIAAAERALRAYKENPTLIREHVNIERAAAEGGYERRQVFELVQNGADALLKEPSIRGTGRIEVLLTPEALYCANQGEPIDLAGLSALLHSHLSAKRGLEIGRFGLGFKSVLAVTDRPLVLSRSVSFHFDPVVGAQRIADAVGEQGKYPRLRIAQPVDPYTAAAEDVVLAELMEWSSTIVKLPRTQDAPHLEKDLETFPAEFMLFSPHVGEVRLVGTDTNIDRRILIETSGDTIVLSDGQRTRTWKIVSVIHPVSEEALKGAGEFSERPEVQLHWAVPLEHTTGRGQFWAFFPTHYETTLSGILNAPWKTQEDRQNLLEGQFNSELIQAAADLIVANCASVSTSDDPSLHLDKFPARGRESPNWADSRLTELVYESAHYFPCIPDLDGVLRDPRTLRLHPRGVPEEALAIWASVDGRPSTWCHRSVETRDRRSRVERILQSPAASHDEWLADLISVGSVEASIAAIRILSLLGDDELTRRTPAVLTTDGSWVPPDNRSVFLLDQPRQTHRLRIVHTDVAASSEARAALEALGIRTLDPTGELDALLAHPLKHWEAPDWERFWTLTRRIETTSCVELLRQRGLTHEIEVRTASGSFRRLLASLLPGPVLRPEDRENRTATIDTSYHAQDMELLRQLGAVEAPRSGVDVTMEAWFEAYRNSQRNAYLRKLSTTGPRPQASYLEFDQHEAVGPLGALPGMSLPARARFTQMALAQPGCLTPWSMRHRTQSLYPVIEVENPTIWMLRSYGAVQTSLGVRACRDAFGPALRQYASWLPVADVDDATCELLGIPNDRRRLDRSAWTEAISRASTSDENSSLGMLYAEAARSGVPRPAELPALGTSERVSPSEITVLLASDLSSRLVLETRGDPFVVVPEQVDVDLLASKWGLRLSDPATHTEISAVDASEAEPVAEHFPLLPMYAGDAVADIQIIRASEVELRIPGPDGTTVRTVSSHWDGQTLIVDDTVDEVTLLETLSAHAHVDLACDDVEAILAQRELDSIETLKRRCREAGSDAERLLQLVDESTLAASLPTGLAEAVASRRGHPLNPAEMAELALSVHGVGALSYFSAALAERSIRVPPLNGGARARRFITELGFPLAFAGSPRSARDPLLRIESAAPLPPLHSYQAQLVEEVRRLVRREQGNRGLLSLPTGAGKTRVAAEALIQSFLDGELCGPILWIAQSDELCEQAVQTWAYLWRSLATGSTLAISRLWAGNDVERVGDALQLVVATVHKLQVVNGDPEYDWVRDADVVVVDEAHMSTTPMYTEALNWLGFAARTSRSNASLLGLTATPFRGTSEAETQRLVSRYGQRRLDHGVLGDDPYTELQRIGVLAKVEHRVLGGSHLRLTNAELDELRTLRRLPRAVEQRLGEDVHRNDLLLEEIASLPDDWPCLLFCTSVQHAELMAGLLTIEGIPARAISGSTDAYQRRHAIDEFRQGRIRVLSNYGVLTQGFDAPKVQAIVVARPTYSPNVYQQMIGRGLRGPANGGSETCLIVNIEDTVEQFGEQLAFREFEHLWRLFTLERA